MSFIEWEQRTLGKVIKHKKGFAFKSKDLVQRGHPVVKVTNFTADSVSMRGCAFISETVVNDYLDVQLNEDDVVIATVGSWPNNPNSIVGKVIKVPAEAHGALLNQNSVILRGRGIDQQFLYYRLKCKDFSDHLIAGARGSANQASIALEDIFKFDFNLPCLTIQKKIACILKALDDKVELNRQTNQTLVAIAQALFKEWFVDFNFPFATGEMQDSELGEIPKGWTVGTIGEIISFRNGKSSPERDEEYSYPVYGANGIIGYANTYNSDGRNIIIGRVGSYCGAVYYTVEKSFVTENAIVAESKNKNTSVFCYLTLQSLNLNNFRVGSGQPLLNQTILSSIRTAVPPDPVLGRFEEVAYPLFESIYENKSQSSTLTKLRDILLPKLMKGEIKIN